MTPDLEERLEFLAITTEDREELRCLRPILEKHADTFVAAFYRHLLSFEFTRRLLSDPDVKQRLLQKQRAYLLSLGGPELDERYAEERLRIGQTHVRVGLEPRWYLGAYAIYLSLALPLIHEAYRHEPLRAERATGALLKLLLLDAQLAMEAYVREREERLRYLNRELAAESLLLGRQFEERGEALRETTERARAAEQLASLATIVAGLAHEIGTPMGVIRGHAEQLETRMGDERSRWRVRTILEQIDRISTIIQTLLNMARPHEPTRGPVNLAQLLDDTLAFLAERFRRRCIGVEASLPRDLEVQAEADRLQQLFLNLFLNAVDAMPDGGVLRVCAEPTGDGVVRIRVSDNGCGIPEDVLPRIFEPFFTTKPEGKGNGLGLMVAREIARDYGGRIEVVSEPGNGTEFRVELPLRGA